MGHRVFHDGLQRQGREHDVLTANVVDDTQLVAKAELLQSQIAFRMLQLLTQENRLFGVDGEHVMAQKAGKIIHGFFRRLRV